jgi:hypothetical protein
MIDKFISDNFVIHHLTSINPGYARPNNFSRRVQ